MKNRGKKFWLTLVILIACLNVSAQITKGNFVSSDGAFRINLSGQPDEISNIREAQAYNLGFGKSFTWKSNSVTYQMQYIKIDTFEKPLTAKRKADILEDMRKRTLSSLSQQNVPTAEKNIFLNNNPGKEIQAIFPAGKMIFRIYLVNKKLYWLIVALRDRDIENEVIEVLNSFKLLDKQEIVAQKLKETTIEALPQTPTAEKIKSDAQDENLKGKVKSVIEDSQENTKSNRERSSEKYFNEQGNLIKEISYINGYPYLINVWGYIDGSRVTDEQDVDYNGDEWELLGILKTVAENENQDSQKSRDMRYAYRYKYKYDEKGNLVEKWMYHNDGDLWLRYVYNFKDNRKETIAYDENDKLNWRSIEILDKNGNVIEDSQFDYNGKMTSKTTYTYELDSQGNWTVQKNFKKTNVKGKTVLKPTSISYRTITYYS